MGYDLSNRNGEFRFTGEGYSMALDLAKLYGWEPQGITGEDSRGGYFSNDGQRVENEDALNIALALERALEDIPEAIIEERTEEDISPLLYWSGYKEDLRGFIDFCKEGAFRIY